MAKKCCKKLKWVWASARVMHPTGKGDQPKTCRMRSLLSPQRREFLINSTLIALRWNNCFPKNRPVWRFNNLRVLFRQTKNYRLNRPTGAFPGGADRLLSVTVTFGVTEESDAEFLLTRPVDQALKGLERLLTGGSATVVTAIFLLSLLSRSAVSTVCRMIFRPRCVRLYSNLIPCFSSS